MNILAIFQFVQKKLGSIHANKKRRDLTDLAGKWDEAEADEFEKNVKIFEKIDSDVWKK